MAGHAQGSSAAAGEDDLPDIIDVVMEMGGASDEPQMVPPPSSASGLPAHLEKLADHARKYVEAASSANGETSTPGGKKRGRPPGSKNATSPPAVEEDNGVDLGALAAEG